jgi:hypothetical protein
LSPTLEGEVLRMASETSFRKASRYLSLFLAQEVDHNLSSTAGFRRGCPSGRRKRGKGRGTSSSGAHFPLAEKKARRLFMEAEGCLVSTQRRGGKKHELKVGISYEGWSPRGEGKWKTRGRRVFLSTSEGATFLSEWSADLATVYDPSGVSEIIWSSNRAFWLKRAPDLFSSTFAQLSRFHLRGSLARALGFSSEASRLFCLVCEKKAREVIAELEKHQEEAVEEKRKKG